MVGDDTANVDDHLIKRLHEGEMILDCIDEPSVGGDEFTAFAFGQGDVQGIVHGRPCCDRYFMCTGQEWASGMQGRTVEKGVRNELVASRDPPPSLGRE